MQTILTQFLDDIEGMRIIITSTVKVQDSMHILQDLMLLLEILQLLKSSIPTYPGWDLIIPGTDLVADFDPNN